jgi:hypothetical protein
MSENEEAEKKEFPFQLPHHLFPYLLALSFPSAFKSPPPPPPFAIKELNINFGNELLQRVCTLSTLEWK